MWLVSRKVTGSHHASHDDHDADNVVNTDMLNLAGVRRFPMGLFHAVVSHPPRRPQFSSCIHTHEGEILTISSWNMHNVTQIPQLCDVAQGRQHRSRGLKERSGGTVTVYHGNQGEREKRDGCFPPSPGLPCQH